MLRFLSVPFVAVILMSVSLRPVVAEALFTGPVPAWVMPVAVPPADPALQAVVTDGVLTLLSDEQVHWDGEERQVFQRSARLITDAAGLAVAGRVDLTFAPDSETVLLGRVTVTRGGQVLDLTDVATAQTLDADASLGGLVAAVVQVPDLQVGDVVDVAYLRRQLPVVAGVNRAGFARLEQDVPVVLAQVVVNWPESWPIYISGWPARVAFVQDTAPGIIRHIWTRQGHVPAPPEPMVPPGYSDNTVIAYSAFPDWSAVTGALSAHYMGSYPLGPVWDTRLRAIQADFATPGERVIAAVRAVQDDLRTDARPVSADAYLARLPADVTAAGGGSALDKALLLRTMLDKMGIEAYVALTNRTQGHDLNGQKPAFAAFDHAIVKTVIDDVTFWFDPTASHEGGDLYNAAMADFGYALPLTGADQAQLEPIDPGYYSGFSTYIEESYDFTLLGVYVTLVTSHYGGAANEQRRARANPDPAAAQTAMADVYTARYPGLRVLAGPEVTDDLVSNTLVVTERYLIPVTALTAIDALVLQTENPLQFTAADLARASASADADARVAPLYIGPPVTWSHRINLYNLPTPVAPPLGASAYGDNLNYAFSGYEPAAGVLTLEWTYDQYQSTVPPDQVAQMLRDAGQIAGNTSFTINLQP